ncbi:hypothetical protein [Haloarchaeobius sp. HRN-SO-5]|uniref:hypothetical protein n=1 Tax=Haloarchaeobius sp. HRN-SO-5 TaxID=3446118 RepID=UPI003EBCC132
MPRRRPLLAAVGTALATAGCLVDDGSPGTDRRDTQSDSLDPGTTGTPPSDDPRPFSETLDVGDLRVRLSGPAVQHSFLHLVQPDTMGVKALDGRQFVFVGVGVEGEPRPAAEDVSLLVDGESVAGWTSYGHRSPYSVGVATGNGRPYSADGEDGWVGFDVPAPVSDDPRLRFSVDGGRATTSLPDRAVEALRTPPPSFSVSEFSAPDSVGPDEPIPVSATVTNEGDGPGSFRASLNQLGPMYGPGPVEVALGAGESERWEESITVHRGLNDVEEVRFAFVTADDEYARTVVVD